MKEFGGGCCYHHCLNLNLPDDGMHLILFEGSRYQVILSSFSSWFRQLDGLDAFCLNLDLPDVAMRLILF